MTLVHFLIIAVCGYLLGSLSFSIIVCKTMLGKDIRDYGSGNAGLTNAYRTMGASKTLLVLLGDIAKGAAAVAIGALLGGPVGKLTAGIFVILGHMFPVFFDFRGGKGVLVGAVMLALFDWRIFLIAFGLFVLAVVCTRWVSLGSLLGAISFPITITVFYHDAVLTGMAFGMAAAVVLMHRANIMRMMRGEENRFSFKSQKTITAAEEAEAAAAAVVVTPPEPAAEGAAPAQPADPVQAETAAPAQPAEPVQTEAAAPAQPAEPVTTEAAAPAAAEPAQPAAEEEQK